MQLGVVKQRAQVSRECWVRRGHLSNLIVLFSVTLDW